MCFLAQLLGWVLIAVNFSNQNGTTALLRILEPQEKAYYLIK